ncbi:MAG: transaldolase [Chloroflexi bacterium]|nr:transaldolase [Chloroflexota bacterium]
MENTIINNRELGQSTWLDFIQRSTLTTGSLGELVRAGITGITSNPTIFEKAVTGSNDYDSALVELSKQGKTPEEIFEALALEDIQGAADILRGVYDETDGADGYASLEVPPDLAHDTERTIAEATRLSSLLNRPNVMIKVPGTPAGILAVRALIRGGINVNVTLIFSADTYARVIDAYIGGLEDRAAEGNDVAHVASVASFFVSRIDTAVDAQLRASGGNAATLTGTAAIANARNAYAMFEREFGGERFASLATKGARPQRPLWASTGTKDPALPDTLYVDQLIGPHTVNTVPPATLDAVLDHGTSRNTLEGTAPQARAALDAIAAAGVDLNQVTDKLLADGVAAFAKSFDDLKTGIEAKCSELTKTRT